MPSEVKARPAINSQWLKKRKGNTPQSLSEVNKCLWDKAGVNGLLLPGVKARSR